MRKGNISLLIGIAIPILMIIFVAISIYLPTLFAQPKYDFLYVTGRNYYALDCYSVENTKLVKKEINYPPNYNPQTSYKAEPRLYIYDVKKNTNREISFEEAQKLNLNAAHMSPDGFEVTTGSHDYSIFSLFFSREDFYGAKYIRGHGISKRLNLIKENENWYDGVRFIGWLM